MFTKSDTYSINPEIVSWVDSMVEILEPDNVHWCDGSQEEWDKLSNELVQTGAFIKLNPEIRPNSFLARSHPSDVARVEDRTFIATSSEQQTGPNNNWRKTEDMRNGLSPFFKGSMKGRTMYVVPFSMGPLGSELSGLGVQVTDSAYAVLNMRIMTRMGTQALKLIDGSQQWVKAVHTVGMPLVDQDANSIQDVPWPCNETKYISHFPETLEVWSFGSGYGGNALLSKKCFALRLASVMGKNDGWLAEHMLLVKASQDGHEPLHFAAAFPSACGKTNLAMLQSTIPGWKIETLGDDIVWMRPGSQGELRAINPEAGFFGVAPGTGYSTNPVAMETIKENTIFTNTALTLDGDVWWEGMTDEIPANLIDWQGNSWTPESATPAAHPNARFTAPLEQCPTVCDEAFDPEGVKLDAIIFGGRRASTVPLVTQSFSWNHGVLIGASIGSEKTAAQEGTVGELRRDPFAMLPFCGYNLADYFGHWIDMGTKLNTPPQIFQVNWFRKDSDGNFVWPGFGENIRVIEWIAKRIRNSKGLEGGVPGIETPIGVLPSLEELNLEGLNISKQHKDLLFKVDMEAWKFEVAGTLSYFDEFEGRVPDLLALELSNQKSRLDS